MRFSEWLQTEKAGNPEDSQGSDREGPRRERAPNLGDGGNGPSLNASGINHPENETDPTRMGRGGIKRIQPRDPEDALKGEKVKRKNLDVQGNTNSDQRIFQELPTQSTN